jgi:hypothetical protein
VDDGTISLKAIHTSGNLVQPPSLYLFARQHPAESGPEIPPPTIIGPVIFFRATRRGTERIDLDITCRHRRLEAYVEELASRINEWYPEAHQARKPTPVQSPATGGKILDSMDKLAPPQMEPPPAAHRRSGKSLPPVKLTTSKKRRPRAANIGTTEKVALVLLLMERQKVAKYLACQLVHTTNKTIERWETDPQVLEILDDLRGKWPNRLDPVTMDKKLEELRTELGI